MLFINLFGEKAKYFQLDNEASAHCPTVSTYSPLLIYKVTSWFQTRLQSLSGYVFVTLFSMPPFNLRGQAEVYCCVAVACTLTSLIFKTTEIQNDFFYYLNHVLSLSMGLYSLVYICMYVCIDLLKNQKPLGI